jgi:hypothetical protein
VRQRIPEPGNSSAHRLRVRDMGWQGWRLR